MHSEKDQAYASAILAQATIKEEGGNVILVTFHEKSTKDFAYFVSRAKKNADRSEWTLLWSSAAGQSSEGYKHYRQLGFWEFANELASRRSGGKVTFVGVKNFIDPTEIFERVTALMHEWSLRLPRRKHRGGFYAAVRDRSNDTEVPPDPQHVTLYRDFCEEHMAVHWIAHYPSGKEVCSSLSELKKHPALHYLYHDSNTAMFYFGFNSQKI